MTAVRADLRALTEQFVLGLADSCTHHEMAATCRQLGLPAPPEKAPGDGDGAAALTKRQRLQRTFDQLDPRRYLDVLFRFLDHGLLLPQQRNEVEDLLWAREPWPKVNRRTRREIVAALEHVPFVWKDADGFRALLRRLWVLQTEVGLWTGRTLEADIERHVFQNPDDWSLLDLFTRLGALDSSDHRFALFIQGLLSGAVTPDEDHQRALAAALTAPLARANLKIIETAHTDGYPTFAIAAAGAAARPPQLILFASTSKKPDLRLCEVLDQQIELVNDAGEVLRYDRPIPESGLTWDQLQAWWADREGVPLDDAKRSLWQRLRAAIPASSPPQLALFDGYHQLVAPGTRFPALLPEVWLHWDPIAKSVRAEDALLTQRMDFLMLLPGHRRVVLEVDGAQHYSTNNHPSPAVYAQTTRGDRDLRLSGYEVYRFSSHELTPDHAQHIITEFFERLLATPT